MDKLTLNTASFKLWYCLSIISSWKSSLFGWSIILYLIINGFGIDIIIISRRSLLWNRFETTLWRVSVLNCILDFKNAFKLLLSIVAKANAQQSEVSCWSWICFETSELSMLLRKRCCPMVVASLNVLNENKLLQSIRINKHND